MCLAQCIEFYYFSFNKIIQNYSIKIQKLLDVPLFKSCHNFLHIPALQVRYVTSWVGPN